MRINRFIAASGAGSRRAADRLIEEGRVSVRRGDLTLTAEPGMQVGPEDTVLIDGIPVSVRQEHIYIIYNKPRGIVSTMQEKDPRSIPNALRLPFRVSYAGRLDAASTGLMLLTSDGDLIEHISRGANKKEKEYICTVDRPLTDEFLEAFRSGVHILDTVTRPCEAERIDEYTFRIVLTQGMNRQIRRMCKSLGRNVVSLCRTRIANLTIDGLLEGQWRYLTQEEKQGLFAAAYGEGNKNGE